MIKFFASIGRVTLCLLFFQIYAQEPFDLPPLPAGRKSLPSVYSNVAPSNPYFLIPKNIWITMKTVPHDRSRLHHNILELYNKNSDWTIHLIDDSKMYEFMTRTFANTSLLWAFNQINPHLMAAKADIWRMAVLWRYGGVYMDADASLSCILSESLKPTDELVLGTEKNPYESPYHPSHPFSQVPIPTGLDNSTLLQWVMISVPFHPVLTRYLNNVVEAVKAQYFHRPFLKDAVHSSIPLIATTGPYLFSVSVFAELVVNPQMRYRYCGPDYEQLKAQFKALHNTYNAHHYLNRLARGAKILISYNDSRSA